MEICAGQLLSSIHKLMNNWRVGQINENENGKAKAVNDKLLSIT